MNAVTFTKEDQQAMRETALAAIGAIQKKTAAFFPPLSHELKRRTENNFLRKQILFPPSGRAVVRKRESPLIQISKIVCLITIGIGIVVIIFALYLLLSGTPEFSAKT